RRGLKEPDREQLETLGAWSTADLGAAGAALCSGRAAYLCWCPGCQRLVTAGRHDSDWRRQFWDEDESPAFLRHVRDLGLLRVLAPGPRRGAPRRAGGGRVGGARRPTPPPATTSGSTATRGTGGGPALRLEGNPAAAGRLGRLGMGA